MRKGGRYSWKREGKGVVEEVQRRYKRNEVCMKCLKVVLSFRKLIF